MQKVRFYLYWLKLLLDLTDSGSFHPFQKSLSFNYNETLHF